MQGAKSIMQCIHGCSELRIEDRADDEPQLSDAEIRQKLDYMNSLLVPTKFRYIDMVRVIERIRLWTETLGATDEIIYYHHLCGVPASLTANFLVCTEQQVYEILLEITSPFSEIVKICEQNYDIRIAYRNYCLLQDLSKDEIDISRTIGTSVLSTKILRKYLQLTSVVEENCLLAQKE